jgi:hypothetical protein
MGLTIDSDLIGTAGPWTPPLIADRFSKIGACGRSFGRGLLRFHDSAAAADAQETVISMWPELDGDVAVFAFDWLGRQFAVIGAGHSETGADDVAFFDLHRHSVESVVEPDEFLQAFQTPLMLQLLEFDLFDRWRTAVSLSGLPFDQCAGEKVPEFLGGTPTVGNLETGDLSVHLAVLSQLWEQVASAPNGARVTAVQIGEDR